MSSVALQNNNNHRRSPALHIFITLVLIIASLYFAAPFFKPLALAILFAFLLSPITSAFQRLGLGRTPSMLLTVIIAFSVLGSVIWGITRQVTILAVELPKYKDNIVKKVHDFRTVGAGTPLEKVQTTMKEVLGEIERESDPAPGLEEPAPVIVQEKEKPKLDLIPLVAGSVVEVLATSGLIIILVMFMLLERQEFRNRLIRLTGQGKLSITTQALDDTFKRISHFLFMQFLINSCFGIAMGTGLYFLGVPYALLWGGLAAILRFIPYLGPWLGAFLPILLSLAVFDSWTQPLMVLGLVVVLELINNMVAEPLLYGHSAGVSQLALIVSIALWTWIWGPVGLLLATPITACLVVISKYVPTMSFIYILMSDEPILESHLCYYQRLLAGDKPEAERVLQAHSRKNNPREIFDELIIPCLNIAQKDRHGRKITREQQHEIFNSISQMMAKFEIPAQESSAHAPETNAPNADPQNSCNVRIAGIAARTQGDEILLQMLAKMMDSSRPMEILMDEFSVLEKTRAVEGKNPDIVCIMSLAPSPVSQVITLCTRIHQRLPQARIIVCRWRMNGSRDSEKVMDEIKSAGADIITSSLMETENHIHMIVQGREGSGPDAAIPEPSRPEKALWAIRRKAW